jgi:formylglycine-generating enzyme required for sulfatase activity
LHPNFCAPSRIKVTYNDVELNMVFVKGGKFLMGAQSENPSLPNYDEDAKLEEGPVRMIKVDDFWISEILVPMEMWPNCTDDMYYDEIVFERKRGKKDNLLFGAYGASYEECERFIDNISKSTNLQFDFPTEEEWEYAARGGCLSKGFKYAGSNDINEVAQYGTGIDGGLCALRKKEPNELGIYDMSGSLYEWCKGLLEINIIKDIDVDVIQSYLNDKYDTPEIRIHLKKGGSISSSADKCRITCREFDIECRSTIFEMPFEKVYLTHIVSQSVMYDDSIKKQYHDEHYWEEYYSDQNGLRLVLRTINSPWEQQCLSTTNKVVVDKFYIDEYGVKYSADKKFLLEGPVEETIKGSHTWKKGVLYDSYIIQADTIVICDKAFFDCRGLTSIKCPNSLQAIGAGAFQNCWSLKEVILNYGILEIGDDAFKDCKSLNSILIPDSISYIARSAFDGSSLNTIYTSLGNGKRLKSMLPNYFDRIEELPF